MGRGLSDYRQALDSLFARTGATSKFGLDRTLALLDTIGNPHHRLRTFHVAGTNGKGSVVAMLYALLRDKGLSFGRYTSPHLIDFRERIVVDDEEVSEEYILSFLDRWRSVAEKLGATFFEITTAMAFDYLASQKVDVAVIETGLGGRLDATNVISPLVSGITSIAIDHVEFLGDTEEQIATEKAGIFKPGVPSVVGAMSDEARRAVLRAVEAAGGSAVIDAQARFTTSDVQVLADGTAFTMSHDGAAQRITTALTGRAQAGNAAVAMTMLDAAGRDWAVSLARAAGVFPAIRLTGRFQRLGKFVFDVAHNPDGIRVLTETLALVEPPRPVTAILGVLSDKDWRKMILQLGPHIDDLVLVLPPTVPAQRAWSPAEALAFAAKNGISARIELDFARAITEGRDTDGTLVVTGSFHTVGDALLLIELARTS
ncbi:MAG: bifunctional folylpolyglutamate synthase/dihydrofolate synthase [Gemmatimonadaceae bacterium]